jgi:hypothetical protein
MNIDWHIKGKQFGNCNCNYGCPCQFNAPPTDNYCHGIGAFLIEEGFFGDINLAGVKAVSMMKFPGPIHDGDGEMQIILDSNSSLDQQNSIQSIIYGKETEPMATAFAMYVSMMTKIHEPLIKNIELDINIETRICNLKAENTIVTKTEPIKNPITGDSHRARIVLPNGMEFKEAEMGSGTTEAIAAFNTSFKNTYVQVAVLNLTPKGIPTN